MNRIFLTSFLFILLLLPSISSGDSSSWKRAKESSPMDLYLFHSTHAINLPTAETLNKGILEIEISHRFIPPISEGIESFYGFDGPVNMRLGIGYALNNRMILTLGRSNVFDNIDLNLKYKMAQFHSNNLPLLLAAKGGIGWNSAKFANRSRGDARNFQYYGQLILNTLIAKKFGIGVVPSYLYNSDIFSSDYEHTITIGSYFQYYATSMMSFLIEWNANVSGLHKSHDGLAYALELETGGHFFKIIVTNSIFLNSSQQLPGSDFSFKSREWRFGFLITRLIKI